MKITQIREKDGVEALSVLDFNLLIEKIKTEIKTRPVTGLRQALHFVLPGESCSFAGKLPKVIPAAVFGRVNGVKRMKVYNGIVELTVGPLADHVCIHGGEWKFREDMDSFYPSGRYVAADAGRS